MGNPPGHMAESTEEQTLNNSTDHAAYIAAIAAAAATLDTATAAVKANESALADIRVEIKTLEKSVPKVTFNDLIKMQCADTMRRRAGHE